MRIGLLVPCCVDACEPEVGTATLVGTCQPPVFHPSTERLPCDA